MTELQKLLTVSEASRRIGINPATLREWADKGLVAYVRTPTGHRRFDPAELDWFIAEMQRPATRTDRED